MRLVTALLFFTLTSISSYAQKNASEDYIRKYHKIAIVEMRTFGIPASITLAQGILESGNGNSKLSKKSNNHFGIKCHKGWKGKKVYYDDDEKDECFRKYKKVSDSYRDHSLFLKDRGRYSSLFELKTQDYKSWARGLKTAGYATNPEYADKLIALIERYDLDQYDKVKRSGKRKIKKPKRRDRKEIFKSENSLKYVKSAEGDSYDLIASQQALWLWELLDYNDRDKDRVLKEGEIVYLEAKKSKASSKFHIVIEGETLYSISQHHGIQLQKLKHRNRFDKNVNLEVGQKIYLRGRKPKSDHSAA